MFVVDEKNIGVENRKCISWLPKKISKMDN